MKRREFWPALLALVAAPKALLGLKNVEPVRTSGYLRVEDPDYVEPETITTVTPRDKYPRAPGRPYCCHMDCDNDAEFGIYGSSGHFEDVTEACAEHVGALLGTPMWLEKENEYWAVYPIGL